MSGDKGFTAWEPSDDPIVPILREGCSISYEQMLKEVQVVVDKLEDEWPLVLRGWLYQMEAAYEHWEKSGPWWKAIQYVFKRGRRAGLLPWEAVSTNRGANHYFFGYDDAEDIASSLIHELGQASLELQEGQDRRFVLWIEAEGYLDRVTPIARRWGVDVMCGSGFDTLTAKHAFAESIDRPTTILHFGDLDGSGQTMAEVGLGQDVARFVQQMNPEEDAGMFEVIRIGLLDHHIEQYGLTGWSPYDEAQQKKTKASGHYFTGTRVCQAEALLPSQAADIVRHAFKENMDVNAVNKQLTKTRLARIKALEILKEKLNESKDDD
jgi:hypothetical protein